MTFVLLGPVVSNIGGKGQNMLIQLGGGITSLGYLTSNCCMECLYGHLIKCKADKQAIRTVIVSFSSVRYANELPSLC